MKLASALIVLMLAIACCPYATANDAMNSPESIGRIPTELMPDVRIARTKLLEFGVQVPDNAETAV